MAFHRQAVVSPRLAQSQPATCQPELAGPTRTRFFSVPGPASFLGVSSWMLPNLAEQEHREVCGEGRVKDS